MLQKLLFFLPMSEESRVVVAQALTVMCAFAVFFLVPQVQEYRNTLVERMLDSYPVEVMTCNILSASLAFKSNYPKSQPIFFAFLVNFWLYAYAGNLAANLLGFGNHPSVFKSADTCLMGFLISIAVNISYQPFTLFFNIVSSPCVIILIELVANFDLVFSAWDHSSQATNEMHRFWVIMCWCFGGNVLRWYFLNKGSLVFKQPDSFFVFCVVYGFSMAFGQYTAQLLSILVPGVFQNAAALTKGQEIMMGYVWLFLITIPSEAFTMFLPKRRRRSIKSKRE